MRAALLILAAAALSGCATSTISRQMREFERLGVTEAEVTGKFSSTTYTAEADADGNTVITLNHSNVWIPRIHVQQVVKAGE